MNDELGELIQPHVDRPELAERMGRFYADLDAVIAARGPTCWNRGACCKFGSYGHRLYVTTAELAYFVGGLRDDPRTPSGEACPYQQDGLCTARTHRPLGCRIFFCDPAAQDWQPAEYEAGLAALKRIGDEFGVEYRYVEWLSALEAVMETAVQQPAAEAPVSPATIDRIRLPVIR